MNFDLWFNKQSLAVKVVLLVLPLVGWIVDALIRWSVFLRKTSSTVNLIMAIVMTFLGELWIPTIIDGIWVALENKLILQE